jgi:uncharacterized membrane protein (DUF2068 family)
MRPLGVVLVGFYQILRGVVGVLFGLSLLFFADLSAKMASLAIEGKAAGRFFGGYGPLAAIVVVLFALLHLAAGYGLLKMQNWGRLLTLFFSAVGLFLLLPLIIVMRGLPLVFGLINLVVIFYLATPSLKRAFRDERNTLRATTA